MCMPALPWHCPGFSPRTTEGMCANSRCGCSCYSLHRAPAMTPMAVLLLCPSPMASAAITAIGLQPAAGSQRSPVKGCWYVPCFSSRYPSAIGVRLFTCSCCMNSSASPPCSCTQSFIRLFINTVPPPAPCVAVPVCVWAVADKQAERQ